MREKCRELASGKSKQNWSVVIGQGRDECGDVRPVRAKYVNVILFFTTLGMICCKCLIEHLKLYHFFTSFIFSGGKVLADRGPGSEVSKKQDRPWIKNRHFSPTKPEPFFSTTDAHGGTRIRAGVKGQSSPARALMGKSLFRFQKCPRIGVHPCPSVVKIVFNGMVQALGYVFKI